MTFSVVVFDREAREWGVGVASRYLSVGSVVPWARAGIGALATQSYANYSYGPDGLELLKTHSAKETVDILTSTDPEREKRQLGIVDSNGEAFAFTGSQCHEYAGHLIGDGFCVQGNILTGENVIKAMASEMEKSGRIEDRITHALLSAEKNGGDRRGRQSAAILVVSESRSFEKGSRIVYDLRVEDHKDPVGELNRLVGLWKATNLDRETVEIDTESENITRRLRNLGYDSLERWAFDGSLENSVSAGKIGAVAYRILMGETNPELKH
jgi:uncharacterized Ntn-hydrolase superfamily protein